MAKTIMIVDNDPGWIDIIDRSVGSKEYYGEGYISSTSAYHAFKSSEKGYYSLVIAGYNAREGMNGVSFAAKIRSIDPNIPIILVAEDTADLPDGVKSSRITGIACKGEFTVLEKLVKKLA